jgi:hypothetical protein
MKPKKGNDERTLETVFPYPHLIKSLKAFCFGRAQGEIFFKMTHDEYRKLVGALLARGEDERFFADLAKCDNNQSIADLICRFYPDAKNLLIDQNGFRRQVRNRCNWFNFWAILKRYLSS